MSEFPWIFLCQVLGYLLQALPPFILFLVPFSVKDIKIGINKIYLAATIYFGLWSMIFACIQCFIEFKRKMNYQYMGNFTLGASVIIFYFISHLFIKGKKIQMAAVFALSLYFSILVFTISDWYVYYAKPNEFLQPYYPANIIGLSVGNIISFPLFYYFVKKQVKRNINYINGKKLKGECLFILFVEVVYGLIVWQTGVYATGNAGRIRMAFLLGNGGTFYLYFSEIILKKKQGEINVEVDTIMKNYKSMQSNIDVTKRMHHDMRHHLRVIQTLIEGGKTEELKNYFKTYEEGLELTENAGICPYLVVDSILKYYLSYARQYNIPVKNEIWLKQNYPFEFMDMTVLLGNCLENALEESRKLPCGKAGIVIDMKHSKDKILILIENKCAIENEGRYQPGIGLQSILAIAKKYDGMAQFKQKEGYFTVKISLKIPNEE